MWISNANHRVSFMVAPSVNSVNLHVFWKGHTWKWLFWPKTQLLQLYKYAQFWATHPIEQFHNKYHNYSSWRLDYNWHNILQYIKNKKGTQSHSRKSCGLQGRQNLIHKPCDTHACSAILQAVWGVNCSINSWTKQYSIKFKTLQQLKQPFFIRCWGHLLEDQLRRFLRSMNLNEIHWVCSFAHFSPSCQITGFSDALIICKRILKIAS